MKWTPQKASCITPFRGYNTDIPRQLLDKYDCATDSGVIRRRVIHPHINARQSTATPHTSKNHDLAKPDIRQRSPNIATLSNTQRTWEWRRPGVSPLDRMCGKPPQPGWSIAVSGMIGAKGHCIPHGCIRATRLTSARAKSAKPLQLT